MKEITNHELINVITSISVFLFAFIEATTKHNGKLCEKNTDLYACYQRIWQDMILGVDSIRKLIDKVKEAKLDYNPHENREIIAYAKSHMISESFFDITNHFCEMALNCLSGSKEVRAALDFAGKAKSIAQTINAFYENLLTYKLTDNELKDYLLKTSRHELIEKELGELSDGISANVEEKPVHKWKHRRTNRIVPDSVLKSTIQRGANRQKTISLFIRGMYSAILILLGLCCVVHMLYLHSELTHIPWG